MATLSVFKKITEVAYVYICAAVANVQVLILTRRVGLHFGRFFPQTHPVTLASRRQKVRFFSVSRFGHICIFTYLTDLLLLIHFFGQ
jgi:hypothetical protein